MRDQSGLLSIDSAGAIFLFGRSLPGIFPECMMLLPSVVFLVFLKLVSALATKRSVSSPGPGHKFALLDSLCFFLVLDFLWVGELIG
jgi:hypothetical protein